MHTDRLRRFAWIGLFAFSSGLPFGVFKDFLPLWLRAEGLSLESIGYLSALAAPWSLKVLWAPLVDRYGARRQWIFATLLSAGCTLMLLSHAGVEPRWALVALIVGFTIAAATQDVAVDAFTIGVLERDEEGPANGVRITLYRASWIMAGGGAVALAGPFGWDAGLAALALVLALAGVIALWAPRRHRGPRAESWGALFGGLAAWFVRPGAVPLALFILLYKWPDAALGPMVHTFRIDSGLSPEQMGALSVPTLLATMGGAALGAVVVARLGLVRGLFVCGLAQACSNLAYAAADVAGGGFTAILVALVIESGCGGLGTTAFLSALMRVCEKDRAASEYALLSALFAFTRELTGSVSGEGVTLLGYAGWFSATALFAVPGLALLASRRLAARFGERALGRGGEQA